MCHKLEIRIKAKRQIECIKKKTLKIKYKKKET